MKKYIHLRSKAIALRKTGASLKEIYTALALPKTTVYYWIKGMPLGRPKRRSEAAIKTTIATWAARRHSAYSLGILQYPQLAQCTTFIDFIVLYMCEGYRKNRNTISVINSTPALIKLALYWFRQLSSKTIYYSLSVYDDHNIPNIIKYWASYLQINEEQIKVYTKSQQGKLAGRRNRLRYGVFAVKVFDTYLRSKLQAWMDKRKMYYDQLGVRVPSPQLIL